MNTGRSSILLALLVTMIAPCVQGEHLAFACPVGNGVTVLIRQDGRVEFGTAPGAVVYGKDGLVSRIGNMAVAHDRDGRIVKIGTVGVVYDVNGRVKDVGSIPVSYDKNGRLAKIGTASVTYYKDGSVKMFGRMDGTFIFLGTD